MARRKKQQDDGPAGLPPWMATYSDLVTLLLTFFVLMIGLGMIAIPSGLVASALGRVRESEK